MATGTWNVFANSTTASSADVNNNFNAVVGDVVPMDAAGSFTNDTFNLGTNTAYWARGYIKNIYCNTIDVGITSAASDYSSTVDDGHILATASTTATTIFLPTAVGVKGHIITVQKTDSTTNLVTLDPSTTETINGNTTTNLLHKYQSISVISDGANWLTPWKELPTGIILPWPTATEPQGFLHCNGQNISRTVYVDLFGVIGVTYGNGDSLTTFTLPDYRGEFLRGWDNAAGNDPDAASRTDRGDSTTGDNVGTKQGTATKLPTTSFLTDSQGNHTHSFSRHGDWPNNDHVSGRYFGWSQGDNASWDLNLSVTVSTSGAHTHTVTGGGDNESRGRNVNVMYIIKT